MCLLLKFILKPDILLTPPLINGRVQIDKMNNKLLLIDKATYYVVYTLLHVGNDK